MFGGKRAPLTVATGLAKAMGEALQQSCRAALGDSIGTPSSSSRLFLTAICGLNVVRSAWLIADHRALLERLGGLLYRDPVVEAHSFSRNGRSSCTRNENPDEIKWIGS